MYSADCITCLLWRLCAVPLSEWVLPAFLIPGLVAPSFRLITDALMSSTVAWGCSAVSLILRFLMRDSGSRPKLKHQLSLTQTQTQTQTHTHTHTRMHTHTPSLSKSLSLSDSCLEKEGSSGNWLMEAALSGRILYPSSSTSGAFYKKKKENWHSHSQCTSHSCTRMWPITLHVRYAHVHCTCTCTLYMYMYCMWPIAYKICTCTCIHMYLRLLLLLVFHWTIGNCLLLSFLESTFDALFSPGYGIICAHVCVCAYILYDTVAVDVHWSELHVYKVSYNYQFRVHVLFVRYVTLLTGVLARVGSWRLRSEILRWSTQGDGRNIKFNWSKLVWSWGKEQAYRVIIETVHMTYTQYSSITHKIGSTQYYNTHEPLALRCQLEPSL